MSERTCDLFQNPHHSPCSPDMAEENAGEATLLICGRHRLEDAVRNVRIKGHPDHGIEAEIQYVKDYLDDPSVSNAGIRQCLNNWLGGLGYIKQVRAALNKEETNK